MGVGFYIRIFRYENDNASPCFFLMLMADDRPFITCHSHKQSHGHTVDQCWSDEPPDHPKCNTQHLISLTYGFTLPLKSMPELYTNNQFFGWYPTVKTPSPFLVHFIFHRICFIDVCFFFVIFCFIYNFEQQQKNSIIMIFCLSISNERRMCVFRFGNLFYWFNPKSQCQ